MRTFWGWLQSLAYVVKGAHDMRLHDDEGVIRNYTRAIELSPDDLDYYYARGHAYWHKRDHARAIADFTTAIELNPNDYYAHLVRGAIYREIGRLQEAIRDLTWVIEMGDPPPLAYHLRAYTHAEHKDYDLALADLDALFALDPENAGALALKSACEAKLAARGSP
ncbi:MAG TPA: tetratricopeptide repeat protein [Candidatus Methylacidiphilales bacterium]|nr:tetratricopeptide repeat protein [Candidatus Methylacidiphilales bacterium]